MMKLPIFHVTFMERSVDLSSLVEVSDPQFIDRMGYGGWYVGFNYRFAGDREYRIFSRELRDGDEVKRSELESTDSGGIRRTHPLLAITTAAGTKGFIDPERSDPNGFNILAVQNMRAEMQELLDAWSRWKEIEPQVYSLLKSR